MLRRSAELVNHACFRMSLGRSSPESGVYPMVWHRDHTIAASKQPYTLESVGSAVLVVDDDPSFRDLISGLLRARGFDIAGHAADEAEAIEAVRQLHPDAVLLDVNLASSDGFALLTRLSGLGVEIPVLLTSSDPDAATEKLAQECGAVGFVPKTQLATTNLRQYLCPR